MSENKVRFKMYKAGKKWLVMGITAISTILGIGMNVSANTIQVNSDSASQISSSVYRVSDKEIKQSSKSKIDSSSSSSSVASSSQANAIVDNESSSLDVNKTSSKTDVSSSSKTSVISSSKVNVNSSTLSSTSSENSSEEIKNTSSSEDKDISSKKHHSEQRYANIIYYDNTSHEILKIDHLEGKFGTQANYDANKNIEYFENKNYRLIFDDYTPTDGYIFNHYFDEENFYYIGFIHKFEEMEQTEKYYEKINYFLQGTNKPLHPSLEKEIVFKRIGYHDLVTNDVFWEDWDYDYGVFKAVASPEIKGYLPDLKYVDSITVIPEITQQHHFIKNVYYAPVLQKAEVIYFDKTTGQQIQTVVLTGAYDSTSDYSTDDMIAKLTNDGYRLLVDEYSATDGNVFTQVGTIGRYYVSLEHETQLVTQEDEVQQTIEYKYEQSLRDGNKLPENGEIASPTVNRKVIFKRNGVKDLVTGEIKWDAWNPESAVFDSVESPVIKGYRVTQQASKKVTVHAGDIDDHQVIYYVPIYEDALIEYVDKTTGKVITTDILSGLQYSQSDYSPLDKINMILQMGYQLVANDFASTDGYIFDGNGSQRVIRIYFDKVVNDQDSTDLKDDQETKTSEKESDSKNNDPSVVISNPTVNVDNPSTSNAQQTVENYNHNDDNDTSSSNDSNEVVENDKQDVEDILNNFNTVQADTISSMKKGAHKGNNMLTDASGALLPQTGNTAYGTWIAVLGAIIAAISAWIDIRDKRKHK